MVHCNSAPSNSAFAKSVFNNNIAHRRVVSDDVTEISRLKRSEEVENMDKVGNVTVSEELGSFSAQVLFSLIEIPPISRRDDVRVQ